MSFTLHPVLEGDCSLIGDWPLCRVLLMNDARFAWLILVPRAENIREIYELEAAERMQLVEEISRASAVLQEATQADKINVAALGNMVPQLHVHVIARYTDDDAWPNPIWSSKTERLPYKDEDREALLGRFRELLSFDG